MSEESDALALGLNMQGYKRAKAQVARLEDEAKVVAETVHGVYKALMDGIKDGKLRELPKKYPTPEIVEKLITDLASARDQMKSYAQNLSADDQKFA